MDLTSEKTNLMNKICSVAGFTTKKEKKGSSKNESPQRNSKGRSVSASAGKSTTKKRVAGKKSPDLDFVMLVIEEPMERPIFRYIPDRASIQRLVMKCTALEDGSINTFVPTNEKKVANDLI